MSELRSAVASASVSRAGRVMVIAAICAVVWTLLLSGMLARHALVSKVAQPITAEQGSSPSIAAPAPLANTKREPERRSPMVAEPDRQTLAEAKARDAQSTQANANAAAPHSTEPPVSTELGAGAGPAAQPAAQASPPDQTAQPNAGATPTRENIAADAARINGDAARQIEGGASPSVAHEDEPTMTSGKSAQPAGVAKAASTSNAKSRVIDRSRDVRAQRHRFASSHGKDMQASEAPRKADREAAARATAQLVNQAPRGNVELPPSGPSSAATPPAQAEAESLESRRATMLGLQPNTQRARAPASAAPSLDRNIEPTRARLEQSWEQRERWLDEQLRRK